MTDFVEDSTTTLAHIKYKDELQKALLDIEKCTNPEDYSNCTELFTVYVTQQATRLLGSPQWVCAYSFNQALGSAWPDAIEE